MSATAVEPPESAALVARPPVSGRIRIRERVIDKVVREASAVIIGVARDEVTVEVTEWGGGLAVRVASRLPIPDLADTEAIRSATPILERVRQMQSALAEEFARLTGRDIRRVSFAVTGAIIPQRKRVR